MKITRLETFMANAGLRNYLFVRLVTDGSLTGIGEASLEWQEKTVETILHEWVAGRVIGADPFNVERIIGDLIRDQYQGGATIMTAISSVEIALWDLIGKACNQPVYRLIGGRYHDHLPVYANGWYGGANSPDEYAERAREVVAMGYKALKFDPFRVAWKQLTIEEAETALAIVAAVRQAVGPRIQLMIEFHGRLDYGSALDMIHQLKPYSPTWCEEPIAPDQVDLLAQLHQHSQLPIAAGERLYTLADFYRLTSLRACDVVQLDVAHCGGLSLSKKIAALAVVQDMRIAPHCSIGPVALAATLHFDFSTPNFMIQETFSDFDVPWRDALVNGWNPLNDGVFAIPDAPGLGLELNEHAIADHPYVQHAFPSLWDNRWLTNFTQNQK